MLIFKRRNKIVINDEDLNNLRLFFYAGELNET